MGKIVFVTGGVRSGKSTYALKKASEEGVSVLFLATALPTDEEMKERIRNHQKERPADWRTLEANRGTLADNIEDEEEALVVDCLSLYVSRRLIEDVPPTEVLDEVEETLELMADVFELSIIVSNEVGLGLVPDNNLARIYTETLGQVNQMVASRADEVFLMVSGIPQRVK